MSDTPMNDELFDIWEAAKTLEDLGISTWRTLPIAGQARCVLYWKPITLLNMRITGFSFHCVKWACGDGNTEKFETLFHGEVYYDGVRHLYFGNKQTQNEGYLYYPDVPQLITALSELEALVQREIGRNNA